MTRKDYVIIADALRSARLDDQSEDKVISAISRALLDDNDRFDSVRFREAVKGVRVSER